MIQESYEKQLLARIISNKDDYYQHADLITSELFVLHRQIFETFVGLINKGRYPTITKMLTCVPLHAEALKDMAVMIDYDIPVSELIIELDEARKLRYINQALVIAGMKDTSDDKIKAITDAVTGIYKSERAQYSDGYTLAKEALTFMQKKVEIEIPFGFKYLDTLTGGIHRSDLVIVAAETSQGKTAFALSIAQNIIDAGRGVAIISLEMTERQIMVRMIAAKSNVAPKKMLTHFEHVQSVASSYKNAKLYVADVGNNAIIHLLGLIRSAVIRYNVEVVVVDYLQLISDKSQKSREQEIGQTARTLKNIAKELDINVIALSQLSRAGRGNNNFPTLSRLRDSGQVEEAADLVLFIYRPESYGIQEFEDNTPTNGMAEIIIAKGRNYGTGKFKCRFNADTTGFRDIEHRGGYGVPEITPWHEEIPF